MYWATLSNILSGRVKWFKRQPHKLEIQRFESFGPHPINYKECIMSYKDKSNFLNNCFEWLFTEEERTPMGFIPLFFIIIIISTIVCLFIISIGRAIMWI